MQGQAPTGRVMPGRAGRQRRDGRVRVVVRRRAGRLTGGRAIHPDHQQRAPGDGRGGDEAAENPSC
jgi:hypothetical protein